MQEFLLVFRFTKSGGTPEPAPSPEQMQSMMKAWQDWIGSIAAQNKLVSTGKRLGEDGRVVKPGNVVTNGPFVEIKEAVGGYMFIRAENIDEAAELSKNCPIFLMNGSVEIRLAISME